MSRKLVLVFLLLSLLAYGALLGQGRRVSDRRREMFLQSQAQQCQLQRISSSQPSQRIESEGGVMEFWDQDEDQFQCAGVAAMRITLQPNSLSLPKYFPSPRLIYIEQGQGLLGVVYPARPETFHTEQQLSRSQDMRCPGGDMHQKIHSIRRGDIIAIPQGAVHWCYNDGNEELVAVSVVELKNPRNQLDQNLRAFMLAGGQPREEQHRLQRERERLRRFERMQRPQVTFQNMMSSCNTKMLEKDFNRPSNLAGQMQQSDNFGGLIVKCDQEVEVVRPDEEEDEFEEQGRMRRRSRSQGRRYVVENEEEKKQEETNTEEEAVEAEIDENGFEETFCTMRIKQNMEVRRESDVHTQQAGRINIVNEHKFPILRMLDMSAERGHLMPNATYTPLWSMTDQRTVYALHGELHVQVVDDNGEPIMNGRVKEGEMFVIPQLYACLMRAGNQGFEWVSFMTNSMPMKNPMAESVMRATPMEVLSNVYQVSPREAQQLKMSRDPKSMLLSPSRTSSY